MFFLENVRKRGEWSLFRPATQNKPAEALIRIFLFCIINDSFFIFYFWNIHSGTEFLNKSTRGNQYSGPEPHNGEFRIAYVSVRSIIMTMPMFRRIPRKLEEILGDEGTNEFSDFINDSFAANKENVMELVSDRFENRLSEELNVFRSEYKTDLADLRAEFKSDIAELRAEVKEDIAELRAELKEDIAELRTELKEDIAELRAELKEDIAELRAELKGEIAELRVEMNEKISELRIEIHKLISAQTRWMLGAIIALTGIFSIIVKM